MVRWCNCDYYWNWFCIKHKEKEWIPKKGWLAVSTYGETYVECVCVCAHCTMVHWCKSGNILHHLKVEHLNLEPIGGVMPFCHYIQTKYIYIVLFG